MNRRNLLKYSIPTSIGVLYSPKLFQKSISTSVKAINETYIISNTDIESINFNFTEFHVKGEYIDFRDLKINFYTIINDENMGLIKTLNNFKNKTSLNLDSMNIDLTESEYYSNNLLPDERGEKVTFKLQIEFEHPEIDTKIEKVDFDIKLSEFEPIEASGGETAQITIDDIDYKIHAFKTTTDDIFEVINKGSNGEIDILIVGAGGGSGSGLNADRGAGGGGEIKYNQEYKVDEKNYTINIGEGGPPDYNGENTIFDNNNDEIIAIGGGSGGTWNTNGKDGASGGGGGGNSPEKTEGGLSLKSTGYEGGAGGGTSDSGRNAGGGGGGAGSKGEDSPDSTEHGGNGGEGLYYGNIFGDEYGENGWFAGGGGGSGRDGGGVGGKGGGGNGATQNDDTSSFRHGIEHTGGGAGASEAHGGSGIILIRYRIK